MTITTISKSDYKGFPLHYSADLDQVVHYDLFEALERTCESAVLLLRGDKMTKLNASYPPSLWIVKQMLEDSMETELAILQVVSNAIQHSSNPLAQEKLLNHLHVRQSTLAPADPIAQFMETRNATIDLFRLFSETDLAQMVEYEGLQVSVLMCGFLIASHVTGHLTAIKNLYLKD